MDIYLTLLWAVCSTALVVLLLFITAVLFKKSLIHIVAEIMYEIRYNILGSLSLLDDWVRQEKELPEELLTGSGRIAVITGGSRGIGQQVVKKLLQHDLHVVIGCRNVQSTRELYENYKAKNFNTGSIAIYHLDVSSLSSVRSFAKIVKEKYQKINLLINNAGIMFGPYKLTEDGYESQFATNYLGHFLLSHLLLPELIRAGSAGSRYSRIVNVSSCAHKVGDIDFDDMNSKNQYIASQCYARSKLAQVLFSNYLNKLMQKDNRHVGVYAVHPGVVNTDLFKEWQLGYLMGQSVRRFFFKSPKQGSISIIYACLSRRLEISTGTYISNSQITPMSPMCYSDDLQQRLFEYSMNELHIKEFGKE